MAFTFLVEDGTIVPNANSYVSLEDATAILEADARMGPTWAALADDTARQMQLVMATSYLEDNYQWFGRKTGPTLTPPEEQPLRWPRKGMQDAEKTCIGEHVMPRELKKATALLALWLIENDGNSTLDSDGVKRFRSDDIEIEWQDGYDGRLAPEFLTKLLRCFGYGPNDRGFKPIVKV